jgi:hypothetical protein
MEVPDKKHTKWLKNMDQGDIAKLVKFTGMSQPTITKAIRKRIANPNLIIMIDQFFDKKLTEISK